MGAKLAALEMIKSGTIFANEMYWHALQSAMAFDEMGIRACVSVCVIDHFIHTFDESVREVLLFPLIAVFSCLFEINFDCFFCSVD